VTGSTHLSFTCGACNYASPTYHTPEDVVEAIRQHAESHASNHSDDPIGTDWTDDEFGTSLYSEALDAAKLPYTVVRSFDQPGAPRVVALVPDRRNVPLIVSAPKLADALRQYVCHHQRLGLTFPMVCLVCGLTQSPEAAFALEKRAREALSMSARAGSGEPGPNRSAGAAPGSTSPGTAPVALVPDVKRADPLTRHDLFNVWLCAQNWSCPDHEFFMDCYLSGCDKHVGSITADWRLVRSEADHDAPTKPTGEPDEEPEHHDGGDDAEREAQARHEASEAEAHEAELRSAGPEPDP
jgi:hypothetical protein